LSQSYVWWASRAQCSALVWALRVPVPGDSVKTNYLGYLPSLKALRSNTYKLHMVEFVSPPSTAVDSARRRAARGLREDCHRAAPTAISASAKAAGCGPDFRTTRPGLRATWRQAPGRQGLGVERNIYSQIYGLRRDVVTADIRIGRKRSPNQHRAGDASAGQL
jgi:hypothetical protein